MEHIASIRVCVCACVWMCACTYACRRMCVDACVYGAFIPKLGNGYIVHKPRYNHATHPYFSMSLHIRLTSNSLPAEKHHPHSYYINVKE